MFKFINAEIHNRFLRTTDPLRTVNLHFLSYHLMKEPFETILTIYSAFLCVYVKMMTEHA